ncbi:Lamin Tail Domain [Halogranum amylolyticum]|uniref:Lamin Tail Domain n=1 Tax=Halogranum amylolyticum TaxID=660520 RepID=A0A1H8NG78_9EURY|nr:lamin tail domain-containing protein [Halogranum amylolyticum]SEO28721.1 Lamin Tail Domain [Halogranum amylolyticum]
MTQSNRVRALVLATLLVVAGAGASAVGTVSADEHQPLRIAEVDADGEYVVVENTGDETVDLDFAEIDFDADGEADETSTFDVGTQIEAGQTIVVATGAEPVNDADVTFEYDSGVIDEDNTVVIRTLASQPLTQNAGDSDFEEPNEGDLTGPDGEDHSEDDPTDGDESTDGDDPTDGDESTDGDDEADGDDEIDEDDESTDGPTVDPGEC